MRVEGLFCAPKFAPNCPENAPNCCWNLLLKATNLDDEKPRNH